MRFKLVLLVLAVFAGVECFAQQPFEVRHFAGSPGGVGIADGIGSDARFQFPSSVWGDGTYLYVSDQSGRAMRRVTIATGEVRLLAADFTSIRGVWGDGSYLYIADCSGRIQRMTLASPEVVTTATDALFRCPLDVWGSGRYLYVTESGVLQLRQPPLPGSLRRIDLVTNEVTTIPTGFSPIKLAGDERELFISAGNQVVAMDVSTNALRNVAAVSGLVGDMWTTGDGFLYVTAEGPDEIVRVNVFTQEVQPLFGTVGSPDWIDGHGSQARLREPAGVWSDGGRLFVADTSNHVIRVGDLTTLEMSTLAGVGVHIADQAQEPATPAGVQWSDGTYLYFPAPLYVYNQIWKMPLTGGPSTLVSGNNAQFTFMTALWGDGQFLYTIDRFGDRLQKVSLSTGEATALVDAPGSHRFQVTSSRNVAGDGKSIYVSGAGSIFKIDPLTGGMQTIPGVTEPAGLWCDGQYLYIADWRNGVIRRMSLATYEITPVSGVAFNYPTDIWGNGTNLYVTDLYRVLKLSLATKEVSTIAGSFGQGLSDGFGANATFTAPYGLWGVGRLLYVANEGRVRTVDIVSGEVVTIAGRPEIIADGTGMNARFNGPTGMWGDTNDLYVTDRANHVLRRINRATGEVQTVAGLAGEAGRIDSTGSKARFNGPAGICSDGAAIYVADSFNNAIRKVTIGTWKVETITPPGGPLAPGGLWCDKSYIYIGDYGGIVRFTISTGAALRLVSGLRGNGPIWGDGRFLYFSDHFGNGLKRFDLVTSETKVINSIPWPQYGNVWGEGRYLYMMSDSSIQRLDLATLEFTTIAGSDQLVGTEDGAGTAARFQQPSGLWSDGATLYVADTGNNAIRTIALPPQSTTTSMVVGYGRVQSATGIAVYQLRSNGVLVSETGVPAVAPIRNGRLYAETAGPVRTGIAIANPNSQSVSISFYFTDAGGQNINSGTMVLPANQQIARFLDEAPFSVSVDARTFTFSASQPVAAVALRGLVNERGDFLMTTLPIADLSRSGSNTVVIPHFVEGGGWTTQIPLLNPTDQSIAGTIRFLDQAGASIETQSYSIAPRTATLIRRSSMDAGVRVGSIRITPNAGQQSPVGLSVFSYTSGGVTLTETGVPSMAPTSTLEIYGENSSTLRSGFAFANAGSQAVTLSYNVVSKDGASVGVRGSIDIPANGQRALFLNELPGAQALAKDFTGTLQVTSSGLISAIGLRVRTNERGEFLLSTTVPGQDTAGSTELYVPHFVQGSGFTTEFILLGGTNRSIDLYSQSGELLTPAIATSVGPET